MLGGILVLSGSGTETRASLARFRRAASTDALTVIQGAKRQTAIRIDAVQRRLGMTEFLNRHRPHILGLLRIMTALLFLEHGLMKLFDFPLAQPGAPDPLPMLLLSAALIEVIGGGLLAVGLLTRPAAFICSVQMAVGYAVAHASKGFWPGANGGDAAILFCFVFLYIVFAGPGSWNLDQARWRSSNRQAL